MRNRLVRLSFRYKQRQRAGAVKVFTTVRQRGAPYPRQLHLGYLASAKIIPARRRTGLEARLREHWRSLFDHDAVEVDWVDAEKKWSARDLPKPRVVVDRKRATEQLRAWLKTGPIVVLSCFGGKPIEGDDDREAFAAFYQESHRFMLRSGINVRDLAAWWRQRELPRLLQCYFRYVGRKSNYHFTRNGFVTYAGIYLGKGFALSQYGRFRRLDRSRAPQQLFLHLQEEELRRRLGTARPHATAAEDGPR